MYRFSSKNGFLIFPRQDTSFFEIYRIKETEGTLKKIGLAIPQTTENFKEYIKTMNVNEEELKQNLMTDKTPNAQSSRLPCQKLTGRASHTTVRTGLVYGGSEMNGIEFVKKVSEWSVPTLFESCYCDSGSHNGTLSHSPAAFSGSTPLISMRSIDT